MTRVYISHARKVLGPNGRGYCVNGIKGFCDRNGLDFHQICREGIEAEELIKTGDEMALRIVKEAENG